MPGAQSNDRVRHGFSIEALRQMPDGDRLAHRASQAKALWRNTGVLDDLTIQARVAELLMVAVDDQSDEVIGMNTTYLAQIPALQLPLWVYRTFVAPTHRQSDIAFHLLHAGIEWHEARFVSGEDTSGMGMYMEVENPLLKKARNEACWPTTGMTFIGTGAGGVHCRVRYFEGARIS